MNRKNIEKSNRSNAAGIPFPLTHEHMQKLRYWYQSKLTNPQLLVLLLVWLKQDFKTVREQKGFPFVYRSISGVDPERNCLRILRQGNVSWVEYSIHIGNRGFIWIPIPVALKGFFWRVLQEHRSYEKPILNVKESCALYDFWISKMTRSRAFRGIKMANKTVWSNYIHKYCQADTVLSSNSKSLYFEKLQHSSADAYQTEIIESNRYQLFKSINNSIDRLILEAEKWEILSNFERSINGRKVIPNRHEKLAKYITENNGLISQIKIDYKEHHREVTKTRSLRIGAKGIVDKSVVIHFFKDLNDLLVISKRKASSRSAFIYYYNQCTYIFSLQLILLTSLRPTHQISPLLAALSVDRFSVKDKGQSRTILLSAFLQEQVIRYQCIQRKLKNIMHCSEKSPFLLFLVDDNFKPMHLSAKKLRIFMDTHWSGHVPYLLRKMFAQTLMELKLPNHLLDRTMGHSRLGEHDGAMTVFLYEEKVMLDALNKLPGIFKIELFND